MTNRPRRSRPTKKPGTTIDLKAEKNTNVTTGTTKTPGDPSPADPAEDDSNAALISGGTIPSAPAGEPTLSKGETAGTAAPDAERNDVSGIAEGADAAAKETGSPDAPPDGDTSLPLEATPASRAFDAPEVPATGDAGKDEDAVRAGAAGEADEAEGRRETTSHFAAEEGLAPDAERPLEEGESEEERATALAAATPAAATGAHDPATDAAVGRRDAGGGFGRALAAAILGAIIALGGAAALQYAGLLPAMGPERGGTQQSADGGDVQQLSGDLAALRNEVEQLRSTQQAAGGSTGQDGNTAELAALDERLTAVEAAGQNAGAAGEAATAAQASADQANTAAAAAQQTATAAQASADQANVAATSAEQTATAAGQTAATARTEAAAAAASAAQAQQVATAAQASSTQAQQTAAAAQATAGEARTAAEAAQATASQSAAALQDFEQRLAAIEAANREAATALAAAGLKSAIDRGGPFMQQLESYAAASGSPEAVETLRAYAADGVPSAAELQAAWPEVEDRILSALAPVASDAPVGEQVLSSLRSLVTVRPAGPAPQIAEGPQAALSRLDAAIEQGDFDAWLAEWQMLPQAARDASAEFAANVEARLATDRVVDQALGAAIQPAAAGNQG